MPKNWPQAQMHASLSSNNVQHQGKISKANISQNSVGSIGVPYQATDTTNLFHVWCWTPELQSKKTVPPLNNCATKGECTTAQLTAKENMPVRVHCRASTSTCCHKHCSGPNLHRFQLLTSATHRATGTRIQPLSKTATHRILIIRACT